METIELNHQFKVSAKRVYNDWLSDKGHSLMTGGEATAKPIEGSHYTAWDDYIYGKQITLKEPTYIKQSWRSTEFNEDDEDSLVEIWLNDNADGCELKLTHSNIPLGQGERYKSGWIEHYFEPMEKNYGKV
ncbi:MAG: SRPBCC domain-containing protein [Bacteroidia bacterium]